MAGWSRRRWGLAAALMLVLGIGLALLVNYIADNRGAITQGQARDERLEQDVLQLDSALDKANRRLRQAGEQPVATPDVATPPPVANEPTQGIPGETGEQGRPGESVQGRPGTRGPRGEPGRPGRPGEPGESVQGPPGPPGESIEGPPGETGAQGPPGESVQGPPGETGPAGGVGPAGPAGERGPAGPAGPSPFPFSFTFQPTPGQTTTCTIASPTEFTCDTQPSGG